jgi:autotransporter-associated beta strand protein
VKKKYVKMALGMSLSLVAYASGTSLWDGGGGNGNTYMSTAANWDDDSVPPFDGSSYLTFGSGGLTSTVDVAARCLGVGLNRDSDFVIADGAGALILGDSGISASAQTMTADARTYTISANVILAADQTWAVMSNTGNTSVVVSGTISDGAASYGLAKSGDGTLVLMGSNSYDGTTGVLSNSIVKVMHASALGGTANGTTVERGGRVDVAGALELAEPLYFGGQGPGSKGVFNNSGTNTLSGLITLTTESTRINSSGGNSILTVSGGITSSVNPFTILNTGGGTIRIVGQPIRIGSGMLWSDQTGKLVLGVAGNLWGNTVLSRVSLSVDAADVFPAGTEISMGKSATLNLNGFSQAINRLKTSDATVAVVTSAVPATLTLNQTTDTSFGGCLAGDLSLIKDGSAGLTLTGTNSLGGSVTVVGGTLTVSASATLNTCTNISVMGGTLKLQTSCGLRDKACLSISSEGQVDVESNCIEQIGGLLLDGAACVDGSYGSTSSDAEHKNDLFFSGKGMLLVSSQPTVVSSAYYVSPEGHATNSGTLALPFATLEQARDTLRRLRQDAALPAGGVTIWLRGGGFGRTNTFELTSADSGTASNPIVYRAFPKEKVRLHGGRILQADWFSQVTEESPVWSRLDAAARGNVMQADLAAQGISDYGILRLRGFNASSTVAAMELFFDGKPQQLARWPDLGENSDEATNGFAYTTGATSPTNFTYRGSRPERWAGANELWFHGCWTHLWADNHVKASSVDTEARLVTLLMAPSYGIISNAPYYAENLLEEISRPGEWYMDRSSGILYFWPPVSPNGHETGVSIQETPLLRLTDVQNVVWCGITFEMARGDLVIISGGINNRLVDCVLRNSGSWAAKIDGGRNMVCGCEITDTGDGGIQLSGGDRNTLSANGNQVRNCTLHNFGRWSWMYKPGVRISGVGHAIVHSRFFDAPHSAIIYGGNYHLIERNEIRSVCRWTSDAGAIYGGRDMGSCGTIIRHNFVHDIATQFGAGYGTHGIYLDDCIAGLEVTGNLCYQISHMAIQHGGGRDNRMENNVIVKCGKGMGADARGLTWSTDVSMTNAAWLNLQAMPYRSAVWSNAFPTLPAIPTDWAETWSQGWMAPRGCVFSRNLGYSNTLWITSSGNATSYYFEITNNLPASDPLFVNEAETNLALSANSPAFSIPGFQDIPFSQIGPESKVFAELARWDFPSAADRSGVSFSLPVQVSPLGVSGLAEVSVPGHPTWAVGLSAAGIEATNPEDAVAGSDWCEFSLAPVSPALLSLSNLTFECHRRGSGTDVTCFLRSSADNFASTLGSVTITTSNVWTRSAIDLSAVAELQYRGVGVIFRMYWYKTEGDSGTQMIAIDNISIHGQTVAAGTLIRVGHLGVRRRKLDIQKGVKAHPPNQSRLIDFFICVRQLSRSNSV